MRRLHSCLTLVALTLSLAARDIAVKNSLELKAAASSAVGGDVIRLASGKYDDVKLRITHNGT
ncbi:MAG: hypothetical protein ORN22_00620, partial [Opitutales bacterium]|nr:hypothetical protein [Opitutales bacterium]